MWCTQATGRIAIEKSPVHADPRRPQRPKSSLINRVTDLNWDCIVEKAHHYSTSRPTVKSFKIFHHLTSLATELSFRLNYRRMSFTTTTSLNYEFINIMDDRKFAKLFNRPLSWTTTKWIHYPTTWRLFFDPNANELHRWRMKTINRAQSLTIYVTVNE